MLLKKTVLLVVLFFIAHVLLANRKGPDYFDVLHYRFDVFLTDSSDVVTVQAVVKVTFPSLVDDQMILDLHKYSALTETGMTVDHVVILQQSTHFEQSEEELVIDIPHRVKIGDTLDIALSYSGVPEDGLIISKNKYDQRTFFADHWPDRAHYWLPVVDHPAEKASCEFRVSAPKQYQVISNGDKKSEIFLENGYRQTYWAETRPIPTKVMVIGVAEFKTFQLDESGFSTAWVYEKTGQQGASDFSEAVDILEMFKQKMNGYPFSKLDHIESTTRYKGMENAGNIFYDESAVAGKGNIGGLIAHEIGHQWFGNAVSEADWNDIWLSESFAEYFQNYFIEKRYGADSLLKSLKKDEIRIAKYEKAFPEKCIHLKRVDVPKKILSPLVYEKGARVLRMLNYRVGDDVFWEILRTYYDTYQYSNATTEDFIRIAENVSGDHLQVFFNQWLDIPGKPNISYTYQLKGNKMILTFIQHTDHLYRLHLDIGVINEAGEQDINSFNIDEKETTITLRKVRSLDDIVIDPLNLIYGNIRAL